MTRDITKNRERAQLDAIIKLLALDVASEPVTRERPDFIIALRDGRSVGVEIVRALDERIAGGRGARIRVKTKVRSRLSAAGIKAWVNVRLNEHTAAQLNGDPVALESEVNAIVELAAKTMSGSLSSRWYNFEWIDHEYEELMGHPRSRDRDVGDLEGTGIKHADAVGIHPHEEPLVTWSGQGSGKNWTIVQDAITSKAKNLGAYRECGADEMWLLVIGSDGSGGELFVDDVEGVAFSSPFDKTVFLEQFEGRCLVLNSGQRRVQEEKA